MIRQGAIQEFDRPHTKPSGIEASIIRGGGLAALKNRRAVRELSVREVHNELHF